MVKLRLALIGACWLAIGNAEATDHKDEILRQLGVALVSGQCSIVLQKEYQVTAGGRLP